MLINSSLKHKHSRLIKSQMPQLLMKKKVIAFYMFQGCHFLIVCTLIQLSKQNQYIVLIMQKTLQYLNAISQGISLRSQNCCQILIHRQDNTSHQLINKSPTKMREIENKAKGIKLTHTKSSNVIRTYKRITPNQKIVNADNSQKKLPQKINTNKSAKHQDFPQMNQKINTKNCIDYKNRRIAERSSVQLDYAKNCGFPQIELKRSKKTIEEYTPRTTIKTQEEGLELSLLVDKSLQFSLIQSGQKLTKETEGKAGNRFFKPNKSKKTLQKLCQSLGRRVVTVQSQDEENESDHISIIEPFQWRISLL